MEWSELSLLLAIADGGSLSAASEHLGLATSTVSRRLRALEDRLGTKLFEAKGRAQIPTAAGRLALDTAREVDERLKQLESQVTGMDERFEGPLRVTCPPLFACYVLMEPLAAFCREYPKIEVELLVTDATVSLIEREADVAIRATRAPQPSLVGQRVGTMNYGIYASARYLERYERHGGPHAYVAWRAEPQRPVAIAAIDPDARASLKVDDLVAKVAAARAGFGLALLPCSVGMKEPDLVCLRRDETDYDLEVWILTVADLRGSARIRTFMQFVGELARAQFRAERASA